MNPTGNSQFYPPVLVDGNTPIIRTRVSVQELNRGSKRESMRRLERRHDGRYDLDMTAEEPHKLHVARPFQPFTIRLGDGEALPAEHPEMLAYAPRHPTATVYRKNGSFEVTDLLLVTGVT